MQDVKDGEKACYAGVPTLSADIAHCFTYASYQNAIPVVRSISLTNETGRRFDKCTVALSSTPPFLRPKTWTLDSIVPGDVVSFSDRRIELDAGYLAGLNEAERGEITLRLTCNGEPCGEQHIPVRLLAREEWGGVADMVQLLPAFAMPNDPAIASILRNAAERLVAHGHFGGLDGYQSGNPQRAFMLAAAIYSSVADLDLHYAEPPASFESRGQKVRRPTTIAAERLATCLDTTLLFASALEAAGLNPVLLMFQGHAAVGVWLQQRTPANAVEQDVIELRKALASREMIAFETTGVTHRPPMTLEMAQRALEPRLDAARAAEFIAAIDVRRSRSCGIMPLASHQPLRHGVGEDRPAQRTSLPLPAMPSLTTMPEAAVEVKPTTAAGRIDRWQKKLLDLTLRNRLLNFPDSKKTVPFLCTDPALLEDRLAKGGSIRLMSLPEQNPLGERDAELYRDVHSRDIQRSFAAEALQRDELASTLDGRQLEARLVDLHRQVRNDLAEGGANTLFMAFGFLSWKKKPEDERSYRAPLLLVPVKLERRSASSRFTLRFHEDEPRFNATLLQFLERDFELKLPQFSGDLPVDEAGVDVPRLLAQMRQAVRDVPGMEVVNDVALSTFSFAKFLMWKDLVERTEALRQNRVVRHLIDTPDKAFESGQGGGAFCDEHDLDRRYAPIDIVNLLPADSSQTAASIAAAEGRDFIIIGPPGTGKSQTIANMIANCLAAGKTVLFVAEKTAALDVVYRRLREHGLGDHCLELHSSKADRRRFLSQLKTSWENGARKPASDWVTVNERLRLRRDELNAYVGALHHRHGNGMTAYQAIGMALGGQDVPVPALSWPVGSQHDEAGLQALESLAGEIGLAFGAIRIRPALQLVDAVDWTSAWQEDLLAAAANLRMASDGLGKALAAFQSSLGLAPKEDVSKSDLNALLQLAEVLRDSVGHDIGIAADRDFAALSPAVAALAALIGDHRTAIAQLAADYDIAGVRALDLSALQQEWRRASATFWPASALGQRKVKQALQGHVRRGEADPEKDLPALAAVMACIDAAEASPLAGKPLAFAGLDTDTAAVGHVLTLADRMRHALHLLHQDKDRQRNVLRAIVPLLSGGFETDAVRPAAGRLLASVSNFELAMEDFAQPAGRMPALPCAEGDHAALRGMLGELAECRHLLRDWTTWCRVRHRGMQAGLGPLVENMEAGGLPAGDTAAAFRLAYCRWWLPRALDADPILQEFRRFRHDQAIRDFRDLDDLARTHATHRVLSSIAHGLPSIQGVPRNSELGLLRHQMGLQRPSRSIREMIGAMPGSFAKLAPCMLMSPLSIAQYLPPDQALFDVVIFDEASQITTWDAVGAIARARQTIIVGDPKQLPPTNFFGRNDDEDDAVAEYEKDLESILDEARASGIPVRDLRWHYRSRSESLIAFSNHHYYQNRLVTFPSPSVEDRAVQMRKVAGGIYDRGKSRTNRIEADAVAAEAVSRMRSWLKLDEKKRPTLCIITFNAQQQSLIMDLLDQARRADAELEWFFAEQRIEPAIVKNLENVQGDERDVILFSITFSQDAAGKRSMDFGALNRDGGERRLNVAVTRARQELVVFSGFTADQIDPSRTKAVGVGHLKTFLDFAERGAIALPAQEAGSVGGFDSAFEEAVAARLERRGWIVVPQVGISGFRIDLGIRHPDFAGAYLAGVECDGATYHSSATARDRDKVREQVLRGLGWTILRVWSTDWWFDAAGCVDRLHGELEAALAADRERRRTADAETGTTHWDMGHELEPIEPLPDEQVPPDDQPLLPETSAEFVALRAASASAPSSLPVTAIVVDMAGMGKPAYRAADLAGFAVDPDQFHESSYTPTLQAMIGAIMEAEAPLRADVLAQRVSRAHGWLRTGGRIRERIDAALAVFDTTEESSGVFLWRTGTVTELVDYRPPVSADLRRGVADIPLAELASVVVANPGIVDTLDPALDLARILGVERLAAGTRARLFEAVVRARAHLAQRQPH